MICLIVEILGKEERKDVEIKLVSLIRNQEVQKFIKLQKTFKDLQKNFPKLIWGKSHKWPPAPTLLSSSSQIESKCNLASMTGNIFRYFP